MIRQLRLVMVFCVVSGWVVMAGLPCAAVLNQGVEGMPIGELFPGSSFAPDAPSFAEVAGLDPGERPLRPEEVVSAFETIAESSPRARLIEYARSHEGRPLVLLAVSESVTVADLDGFRARHVELLDGAGGGDMEHAKAVAWMAYGIHGDELSSPDAAVALAYWLTFGTDDRARSLRESLLVLIDPVENPDGRARYLAQNLSFAHKTANPDSEDLSHTNVWPWGRGNHYLFDMNRDWFMLTQPESERSRVIAEWLPQLVVDCHEMGANSTYLFPPPRHPFNPHLPPNVRAWEESFSNDQARALDELGYPYFSGEWNEEFFPGYGSSWAAYHGAVGILYEMSRTSGTLVRKRGGTVRTFAQAVEHQVTSSVANLQTLAASSAEILEDHRAARRLAVTRGGEGARRFWVFPDDQQSPSRLDELARLLTDQGIEVLELDQKLLRGSGLTDVRSGRRVDVDLGRGTLLVRLDQPAGFLVRALLDAHVPMAAPFLREERQYLERGKGSRLYETTAWSIPLAYGVDALWGKELPDASWAPWVAGQREVEPFDSAAFQSAVFDGSSDRAPAMLAGLLQAGLTVRVAEKPFTIGGRSFERGAIVVRREGNPAHAADVLAELSARHQVELVPVVTSRSDDGPDLGGSHFPVLVPPRTAVLAGMPVSLTDYGSVWHLLDQQLDLRFSALDVGRFSRFDLARYNVLVLPPVFGGAETYRQVLGQGGLKKLRRWIEAGGTVIGFGGGARFLADSSIELTTARLRSQALDEYPPPVWSITAEQAEQAGPLEAAGFRPERSADDHSLSLYDVAPVLGPGARPFAEGQDQGKALPRGPVSLQEWLKPVLPPGQAAPRDSDLERADARLRRFMPQGAMLRVELDPEQWLSFGLGEDITVWFGSRDTLVATPPVTVAGRFSDVEHLHLGGLLWPEAAARMAHTAYATREGLGRGQVILFADNPAFRRWMKESERMLINAVLLGPGLGTRWSTPW